MDKYKLIRERLSRKRLEGILVSNLANIRYLTGFDGSSAMLFVGLRGNFFFTDFRYKYEAAELVPGDEFIIVRTDFLREVRKTLKAAGVKRLGFEYGAQYQVFEKLNGHFELHPLKGIVEELRMIKDRAEMQSIITAVKRAERAFEKTRKWIRAGITEQKVAMLLEHNLKKEGCRRIPFDIIVASGRNSALPHARVTEKKIERGDLVIVDWGGEADGYFSDMTRTFLIGGADLAGKKKMYQAVLRANRRAINSIEEGVPCRDVDAAARDSIAGDGYGDFFGHATGHGVGLDVHERPAVSSKSRDRIGEGVVVTVEPGIYIPDVGGVRIEDMVTVLRGKRKCLTSLPKGLEIL